MKTAFIFYSYTGKTKALAAKRARKENAVLVEIQESKPRSKAAAYILGSLAARKQKKVSIAEVSPSLMEFGRFIVAVPLWAGFPAPAFNSILELLPKESELELIITSGSGDSSKNKAKTLALAAAKGIKIVKYLDVKTSGN